MPRAAAFMVGAALLFALMSVMVKVLAHSLPNAMVVFLRSALSLVVLLPPILRRGVGRLILRLCEQAARAEGFARAELGATAGGEPLYRACGYTEIERMDVPTPGNVTVPITRMGKKL